MPLPRTPTEYRNMTEDHHGHCHHKLSSEDMEKLDNLYQELIERTKYLVGYPVNSRMDNETYLSRFLDFTINNVGDPFQSSNYSVNTTRFELEVLEFFADVLNCPKDSYWGYVTNGGTEGNMFGLYLAREKYPDAVYYFSEDTHYSVAKSLKILNIKDMVQVKSLPNGEIDYEALEKCLDPKRPAVLLLNIGTTMKGAIDNVPKILEILRNNGITQKYVHCDGALTGIMLPFIDDAIKIDFSLDIDSFSISGHKFLGCPVPCGVVLTRKSNVDLVKQSIEYIGAHDCTISGSRDGFSCLILWVELMRFGKEGLKQKVQKCMKTTEYAKEKLKEIGWNCWSNPYSNIVVIDRPPQDFVQKWALASQENWSHIVLMPNVKENVVDVFVEELRRLKGQLEIAKKAEANIRSAKIQHFPRC